MAEIAPVKVGVLVDYVEGSEHVDPVVDRVFRLTFDEYLAAGVLERPIELVLRAAQGLPNGSFRAVRHAFHELVAEDCVAIFGPYVSENGEPLRRYVEELAEVPILTMAGTESMLGEWVFALNNGSMEEEPIIMAAVCRHDGRQSVGIAYEQSLIGQEYLATCRRACVAAGLRITGEVAIPQVATEKHVAMEQLRGGNPDAIVHVGFGLGLLGMNDALEAIGWMPPRYTTTAFEFAHGSDTWMQQLAGWVGLDSFDERNPVGKEFLDRYEAGSRRSPRVLHAGVLLRHGAHDRARHRGGEAAHRHRGQGGVGAREDGPGGVGGTGHVDALRPVHPPGVDGRGVPGGAARPARRQPHGVPRHHRRFPRSRGAVAVTVRVVQWTTGPGPATPTL